MNRRQALLSISAVAGHTLFPDVLAAWARAWTAGAPDTWQPVLVPTRMAPVLAEAVETILPETDTPGAKAAGVHVFVDLAAKHCLSAQDQTSLVAALEGLGSGFVVLPAPERERRLESLAPAALSTLKDLTLLGYFSSEIGCTQALAYDQVPGDYRGCTDLLPNQRAWATR